MLRSKLSYLNFILTVIAVCLTIIVLQNANVIPSAKAHSAAGIPLTENGEVLVKVVNSVMDVNIYDVATSCSDLPVRVENTVRVKQ